MEYTYLRKSVVFKVLTKIPEDKKNEVIAYLFNHLDKEEEIINTIIDHNDGEIHLLGLKQSELEDLKNLGCNIISVTDQVDQIFVLNQQDSDWVNIFSSLDKAKEYALNEFGIKPSSWEELKNPKNNWVSKFRHNTFFISLRPIDGDLGNDPSLYGK